MMSNQNYSLGLNNGFAMKRWPEADIWADLIANQIGVDLVQISLDLVDLNCGSAALDAQAKAIAKACDANGLRISSVFTGLQDYSQNMLGHPERAFRHAAYQRFETAIELTAMLGAPIFGGHIAALSHRDHSSPDRQQARRASIIEDVAQLAARAGAAGLTDFLWEPMPVAREWPSTIEECERVMALFPPHESSADVGYCMDVGHCCRPDLSKDDQDPYHWISRTAKFSPIIHLQQTDGLGDRHWCFDDAANADGIIHPERTIGALNRAPDSKVRQLILEVFPPFEERDDVVVQKLKASIEYWRPWV